MSGLAIRDEDGIVHWAPFGEHTDEHMSDVLKETRVTAWGTRCEHYDADHNLHAPRLVEGVSIRSNDVTCILCLSVFDED